MKHHVFKSKDDLKWFHCGYCPCDGDMRYEEPDYDHSRCINAHPETITMMQETGMFGFVNKNTWWLKQWWEKRIQ